MSIAVTVWLSGRRYAAGEARFSQSHRHYWVLVEMRIVFANPTPIEYTYDKKGDVLYLTFARQKATRTLEILKDWPILLADLNDQNEIIGLEYVGYKQFGIDTFKRLVLERLRTFGIELGEQESDSFVSFMHTPEAAVALSD
jgi:uncharacterized protein YuzE